MLWKCRILPPPKSGNCELNSKVRDHSEFDSRPWQTRWTEFERFVRSYDIDVSNYDEETWNDYVAELGDDVIEYEYDVAHIEVDGRFTSTIPVLCRVGDCIYRCSNRTTWKKLYLAIVEHEIAAANPVLDDLYIDSFRDVAVRSRKPSRFLNSETNFFEVEPLQSKTSTLTCQLSSGWYIYCNYSAMYLCAVIATFACYCDYTSSEIAIYAMPKGGNVANHSAPSRPTTMVRRGSHGEPESARVSYSNRDRTCGLQRERSVANTTVHGAISTYRAELDDDDRSLDVDMQASEIRLISTLPPKVVNRAEVTRIKCCDYIKDFPVGERRLNDVFIWLLKKMIEQARYHISALCKQNAYSWMSQSRRMLKNAVDLGYGYYFDLENDLTMYDVVCFIEDFLHRANIPRYEVVIYAERDRTALGDGAPSGRYRVPAAVPREAAPAKE